MLYKNTKSIVRSFYSHTDFFDIVVGVLQGEIFTPYLLIIRQNYVLLTSIDLMKKYSHSKKKLRSRKYSTEIITNADNVDDQALLTNTPAQVKSILHRVEQAARGNYFYV